MGRANSRAFSDPVSVKSLMRQVSCQEESGSTEAKTVWKKADHAQVCPFPPLLSNCASVNSLSSSIINTQFCWFYIFISEIQSYKFLFLVCLLFYWSIRSEPCNGWGNLSAFSSQRSHPLQRPWRKENKTNGDRWMRNGKSNKTKQKKTGLEWMDYIN